MSDIRIGKALCEPSWSWEKCVKPIAKTSRSEATHPQYVISGRVKFIIDERSVEEFGPGHVGIIPRGHKACVVGDKKYVTIDFTGVTTFAKNQ